VRQPWKQDRRAAELERATDAAEPDWEGLAMIFELAGLTISGINLALNLQKTYKDWSSWKEADVEVDLEWIDVALDKGVIEGKNRDFEWMRLTRLPIAELKHTHSAVIAINEKKRIKYRIVVGRPDDRLILVKRLG
jgi:hypothetical protein